VDKKSLGGILMKHVFKMFGLLILVLGLLMVTMACSGQPEQVQSGQSSEQIDQSGEKTGQQEIIQLKLATGNTGSAIYALGGGFGQVIEKYIPGTKVTVVGTAGYGENAVLVATKQADIGTSSRAVAEGALKQKPELLEDLRVIATAHQTLQHVVVPAESEIKSFSDLIGKKVSVGEPGSGTERVSKFLLEVYDLDYEKIKPQYLSFNESVDALQNGTVDAIFISTMFPNPGILSLATQKQIRFLEMSEQEVNELNELMGPGLVYGKIPANTYPNQKEDVYTMATPAEYVVHKDMPDDLAYQLVKNMIEHADEVANVHPAGKQWTVENALLGVSWPYHPGAVKYYKEIGAWENRDPQVLEE